MEYNPSFYISYSSSHQLHPPQNLLKKFIRKVKGTQETKRENERVNKKQKPFYDQRIHNKSDHIKAENEITKYSDCNLLKERESILVQSMKSKALQHQP